jgi:glycosyltransferase involved in cell wall biosynthesis
MKIGIDIRTLMDVQYSGVSEYTYNLLKGLFRLDKENEYKLFYNSFRDLSGQVPEFSEPSVETVYTRYPNKLFNNIMQRVIKAPKIDRRLAVDLFFMPNIGYIALSSSKKVITIHDLSFLRYPEFFSVKRRLWHLIMNFRNMLRQFDQIIAVSDNTKHDIIQLCGIKEEKIKVIYSGVKKQYRKLDINDKKFNKIEEKYQLPRDFVFFLGTHEPRKNIQGLIKAFDLLCDKKAAQGYDLVIAGTKGWKGSIIYKAWKESKFKERIHFAGYVADKDKVYLYNLAKVFIYPSFYEGFGFPPLEAMACGTPVITSHTSSLPEIVGSAALMIDPYNINDIALSLEQLLGDKDLREKLSQRGLKQAEIFSWDNSAREHLLLFKDLYFDKIS